jgi:hypothetical protein
MLDDRPRLKLMIDHLRNEVACGRIDNSWEERFIGDMTDRLALGRPFTEKQVATLERLFERY